MGIPRLMGLVQGDILFQCESLGINHRDGDNHPFRAGFISFLVQEILPSHRARLRSRHPRRITSNPHVKDSLFTYRS